MRFKYSLVSLFAIASLSFLTPSNSIKFGVTGNIKGLGNDSVILMFDNSERRETIATVASNDRFQLSGETPAIALAYIYFGGIRSRNSTYLVLENGQIHLEGNINAPDDIDLSGTQQNLDLSQNRREEMVFYNRIRPISEKLSTKPDKETEQRLYAQIDALRDSVKMGRIKFNESHPRSVASLMNLWVLQDNLDIPVLEKLFNTLTPEVQGLFYGPDIKAKIVARKRVGIGNNAPEFSKKDLSGNLVSVASFKGKYVLFDFWASWCVPCRAENPYLKAAYRNLNSKGLEIVSISVDADQNKWLDAVKQDSLPWKHVLDGPYPKDGIAKLYSVQPIPDNFLISPEGKILARGLRGEELEKRISAEMQKGMVLRN